MAAVSRISTMKVDSPRRAVLRPYPGHDAVDYAYNRGLGRDEPAHLRHDDDERALAQVDALAAHIGTGQNYYLRVFVSDAQVVGHERAGVHVALGHRVAALFDGEFRPVAMTGRVKSYLSALSARA